ncbi:uncharacterized protein LOC135248603 isoform X3 [Anguilla rostrata]|uniref:uncharacterized protein LOC135248603 isoform X3 n=1 Tax=Anguilla rostrata TaxID=7938 RepID=UPI0030D15931
MSKCDSDSSPTNRTHGVRDPEKPPGPGHHLSSNIENKKGITVSPIFHECNFGHDVSNTINITANIVNGVIEPASPSTCPQVGMNRGGQRATKRSCAPCTDMTTAPQKREKENTDDTIAGYIHRVSRIMTSAKRHRYFTATFQSREGFHRTVIFDVDRYARFQHASTNQTPVELERITKEHSFNDPSSFKIICNRETILTNTSVDFPVKTVDDFSKFTIDKIKTMPSKQPIPSIDAHVSALQPATSQVTKWGGDLEAKECWISDSTSSIQLTLWNKAITTVELQKSYRFSNLTTRQFLGETFLTITPSTKITPIDTLKNIHPMPTEGTCNENVLAIEAEVTAVSITQRHT